MVEGASILLRDNALDPGNRSRVSHVLYKAVRRRAMRCSVMSVSWSLRATTPMIDAGTGELREPRPVPIVVESIGD